MWLGGGERSPPTSSHGPEPPRPIPHSGKQGEAINDPPHVSCSSGPANCSRTPLTCIPLGQKGLRGLREAPPPSSAPANDLQTSPNSSGWTLPGQTAVTPAGLGGGSRGSAPLHAFHPLPAPGAESSLCAPHPWGTWQWLTAASQDRNIPGISLATCAQPLPK